MQVFVPALAALCMAQLAAAQTPAGSTPASVAARSTASDEIPNLGVADWLKRMHGAARRHSYMGTFVVTVAAGNLSSARIWHACEGVNLHIEGLA